MSATLDRETPRWYIMRLPEMHRGRAASLEKAKLLCIENGDTTFDYLAPTFKEKRIRNGKETLVDISTLFNYVFVHSSVATIFELKKSVMSAYNFMRKRTFHGKEYFPYVNDDTMENLRWVASSYKNILPCYVPATSKLKRGDTIRFTSGHFNGRSAEIVTLQGTNKKEFVIRIRIKDGSSDDAELCSVPIRVGLDDCTYVVEHLNLDDKQTYARLDNPKLLTELFSALIRQRQTLLTNDADRQLAERILSQYGSLTQDFTDIIRTKIFSYLLPAYRLLGLRRQYEDAIHAASAFAGSLKAKQSRLLLSTVLFACTADHFWHQQALHLLSSETTPHPSSVPHDSVVGPSLSPRHSQYHTWLNLLSTAYRPSNLHPLQRHHVATTFPHLISLLSPTQEPSLSCLPCPATSSPEKSLHQALDDLNPSALLTLRPTLLNSTYTIATNHDTRHLSQYLLWATTSLPTTTPEARQLRALLLADVLRTI